MCCALQPAEQEAAAARAPAVEAPEASKEGKEDAAVEKGMEDADEKKEKKPRHRVNEELYCAFKYFDRCGAARPAPCRACL